MTRKRGINQGRLRAISNSFRDCGIIEIEPRIDIKTGQITSLKTYSDSGEILEIRDDGTENIFDLELKVRKFVTEKRKNYHNGNPKTDVEPDNSKKGKGKKQ